MMEHPQLADLICIAITRIINNEVTDDLRRRLARCNLTALPKAPTKIRPIAVGEVWLKIASIYVIRTNSAIIRDHFGSIQLGVGAPCGVERIVHHLRKLLHDSPDGIVLTIDAKNAFNSPCRSAIKAQLEKDAKWHPFYSLYNLAYSQPSELIYTDADGKETTIPSTRGTRQGDPLGGFFFCLAIHPILEDIRNDKTFKDITIRAYCDDISLFGTDARLVTKCYERIKRGLNAINIEIHPQKCEWYSTQECPASLKDFKTYDVKGTNAKDAIRILGAYFGTDDAIRAKLEDQDKDSIALMFERVQKVGGQIGLLIQSRTLSPRMGFLLRTHPPEVLLPIAERFDAHQEHTIRAMAEIDMDPDTSKLIFLSTKLGGLGLLSSVKINEHAYAASTAYYEMAETNDAKEHKELAKSIATQASRVAQQDQAIFEELKRKRRFKHLLEETTQNCASSFLRSLPADGTQPLDCAITGAALRLRLNARHRRFTNDVPCKCPGAHTGGFPLKDFNANSHLAGCTHITGDNASTAHALFKKRVCDILRADGWMVYSTEPRDFAYIVCPKCDHLLLRSDEDELKTHAKRCTQKVSEAALLTATRRGPDIRIKHPNHPQSIVIDVTMTSHVLLEATSANKKAEATFLKREAIKNKLYRRAAEASGEEFVVLTATNTGALSGQAEQLLTVIGNHSTSCITDAQRRDLIAQAATQARSWSLIQAEKACKIQHTQQPRRELTGTTDLSTGSSSTPPGGHHRPDQQIRDTFGQTTHADVRYTTTRHHQQRLGLRARILNRRTILRGVRSYTVDLLVPNARKVFEAGCKPDRHLQAPTGVIALSTTVVATAAPLHSIMCWFSIADRIPRFPSSASDIFLSTSMLVTTVSSVAPALIRFLSCRLTKTICKQEIDFGCTGVVLSRTAFVASMSYHSLLSRRARQIGEDYIHEIALTGLGVISTYIGAVCLRLLKWRRSAQGWAYEDFPASRVLALPFPIRWITLGLPSSISDSVTLLTSQLFERRPLSRAPRIVFWYVANNVYLSLTTFYAYSLGELCSVTIETLLRDSYTPLQDRDQSPYLVKMASTMGNVLSHWLLTFALPYLYGAYAVVSDIVWSVLVVIPWRTILVVIVILGLMCLAHALWPKWKSSESVGTNVIKPFVQSTAKILPYIIGISFISYVIYFHMYNMYAGLSYFGSTSPLALWERTKEIFGFTADAEPTNYRATFENATLSAQHKLLSFWSSENQPRLPPTAPTTPLNNTNTSNAHFKKQFGEHDSEAYIPNFMKHAGSFFTAASARMTMRTGHSTNSSNNGPDNCHSTTTNNANNTQHRTAASTTPASSICNGNVSGSYTTYDCFYDRHVVPFARTLFRIPSTEKAFSPSSYYNTTSMAAEKNDSSMSSMCVDDNDWSYLLHQPTAPTCSCSVKPSNKKEP